MHWLGLNRPFAPLYAWAAAALLVLGYALLSVRTLAEPVPAAVLQAGGSAARFAPSDLFMPWFGARALLAWQNPYTASFASALHRAYYGVDLSGSTALAHPAGFYYPPFVVLTMLPLLWLPFGVARLAGGALLIAAVVYGALLWLRLVAPAAGVRSRALAVGWVLLFFPTISLLLLQQLSGAVLLYLVAAHYAAARGRLFLSGSLLSLALLKPQLALLPAAGLLFWSICRRDRSALWKAFASGTALELAVAELLLPGWLDPFREALARRDATIPSTWLPQLLAGSHAAGLLVAAAVLALLAWRWWQARRLPVDAPDGLAAVALGFAANLALVPDVALYNQALLIVPVLALAFRPYPGGGFARASLWLAALAVSVPVGVMGLAFWAGAIGIGYGALTPVLSLLVDAMHVALPLLLLPALAAGAGPAAPTGIDEHALRLRLLGAAS